MRRMHWAALAVSTACAGLAALTTRSALSQGSAAQAVRQLQDRSVAATLKRDAAFFEGALSDDFVNITAGGRALTKRETLDDLRLGNPRILSLHVEGLKVRTYGDTAVMTGITVIRGRKTERDRRGRQWESRFSGNGRFTRVFAQRDGRWQIVSHQTTPLNMNDEGEEPDTD